MFRRLIIAGAVAAVGSLSAGPAWACGGLVAPNGSVRLERTTTLAAYHQGVEHYVTSFTFAGGSTDFGSIIPLPGVPTDVRRAGSWTLQRLERETHPPAPEAFDRLANAATASVGATVLLHTTVDALDINVLSGGGQDVLDWVKAHGYEVSADAPAMLDFYAQRSPVFLAARFDAKAAAARGQQAGDGTPVQITIPTPQPWVPLHILALAKTQAEVVQADVYLLTDREPALLDSDPGVSVRVSEAASESLLTDLRSDKDSAWVPDAAWLTEVDINSASQALTHDLAIDPSGAAEPNVGQAGYDAFGTVPAARLAGLRTVPAAVQAENPAPLGGRARGGLPEATVVILLGLGLLVVAAAVVVVAAGGRWA